MNTLVYSRKAYKQDKRFAQIVERAASEADNQQHHIELIQYEYPNHTVEPLYTYEHGMLTIERSPSCQWDSSADGMCAYKNEPELEKKIEQINNKLHGEYYE